MFNTFRQVDGAVAIAVFGALIADRTQFTGGLQTSLTIAAALLMATVAISSVLGEGQAARFVPVGELPDVELSPTAAAVLHRFWVDTPSGLGSLVLTDADRAPLGLGAGRTRRWTPSFLTAHGPVVYPVAELRRVSQRRHPGRRLRRTPRRAGPGGMGVFESGAAGCADGGSAAGRLDERAARVVTGRLGRPPAVLPR